VTADDPSVHSSQNEQDNRNYAKFAKIPMLEPSDSQEGKEFIKKAFEISEIFDTPVFLRTTTRVSHSKSIVELEDPAERLEKKIEQLDASKYVMVPALARIRRVVVEERLIKLREFAETFSENKIEINNPRVGIITAGMPYHYAKEVFPEYSYLKLGMVYPLPEKMIREFASRVRKIYIVEELDPFIEEQVKAMGIKVTGKEIFPYRNEFDPGVIRNALKKGRPKKIDLSTLKIPQRPPNLCSGCPHRGLFYVLGKSGAFVTSDIGCYTLSFMEPLKGLHSCICMGASIGMAHGLSKALKLEGKGKVVGVLGDSTFVHSGITPLLNSAYNKSDIVIIIADNSTTAMTGMQQHPGTGMTLQGESTTTLNYESLAEALGVSNIRVVNPYDLKSVRSVLKEELDKSGPSLIISKAPCVLQSRSEMKCEAYKVDLEKCVGCQSCIDLGCPSISWRKYDKDTKIDISKYHDKQKGIAMIDLTTCTGCSLCEQLCKSKAITEER
jgi:indolepyruvate ferredoxin oxidoreductase alpha subunit